MPLAGRCAGRLQSDIVLAYAKDETDERVLFGVEVDVHACAASRRAPPALPA
jgi:hypothetical protein